MTFPTVVSEASSKQDSNTTTHTVAMPASITAGKILVSVLSFDTRPARSGQIVDDWTEITNTSDSGDNCSLYGYWKIATGSEGASQTIVTNTSECSGHQTWQIDGFAAGTAPASVTFQGPSAGTSANPAALDPAGWGTEDTLWLTAVSLDDGTVTVTGFPSSYTGTGQVNADSSADGVSLGWARRENATGSEDPGAFTLSASTTFCCVTIGIRAAQPVTHLATGTKAGTGTTTQALAYPSGVAAGVLAIAGRSAWNETVTATSETGWLNHTDLLGGLVAVAANDAHQTRVAVDTRELDGSESGSVTFDQTNANGVIGLITLYTKFPSTATWDIATTTGDDATHGANRSVTGSGSVALAPGDVVVAVAAVDTDTSMTVTSPAITASGITFGTTTRRTSGAGVGTGNDGNIEVFDAQVTAGTGTAAPVLAFTTATNQCGPVAFLRLRSVSSTNTNATATNALGAGTASAASSSVAPTAGSPSGAGAAPAAAPNIRPSAAGPGSAGSALQATTTISSTINPATGTGNAPQPATAVLVHAGLASGAGDAPTATASTAAVTQAPAGLAAGTGTAELAAVSSAATAGTTAGAGTALQPAVAVAVNAGFASGAGAAAPATASTVAVAQAAAGLAAGTGTASQSAASVFAPAGSPAGSATAGPSAPSVAPSVGSGAGAGTAAQATTSSTVNSVFAPAGLAGGSGTAAGASPAAAPTVGLAAATVTAGASSAGVSAVAGLSAGSSSAPPPSPSTAAHAGAATAAGAANAAAVDASASASAQAGLASATGAAFSPAPSLFAMAGVASSAGFAIRAVIPTGLESEDQITVTASRLARR